MFGWRQNLLDKLVHMFYDLSHKELEDYGMVENYSCTIRKGKSNGLRERGPMACERRIRLDFVPRTLNRFYKKYLRETKTNLVGFLGFEFCLVIVPILYPFGMPRDAGIGISCILVISRVSFPRRFRKTTAA